MPVVAGQGRDSARPVIHPDQIGYQFVLENCGSSGLTNRLPLGP